MVRRSTTLRGMVPNMCFPFYRPGKPGALGAVALIAGLLASGCGDQGAPLDGYPPPGEIRLVSVAPLERVIPSLLHNGDMSKWWAGAPVPEGFHAPNSKMSMVKRPGENSKARLVQTWWAQDFERPIEDLFSAEIRNTAPNTAYRLSVTAAAAYGVTASLSIWERNAMGVPVLIEPDFIVLMPGNMTVKEYAKTFKTREGGTLIVAAHANASTLGEASVFWYRWDLTTPEAS